MEPRNIIIQLLIQDMRHEQLLSTLNNIGFETSAYTLDIMDIVSHLMGIPAENASWQWCDT